MADEKTKKHPVEIVGFDGSIEECASAIGKMRYDKVAEFFGHLEKELLRQAEGDKKRGRLLLSAYLTIATHLLEKSRKQLERIFSMCRPFMKDELESDE
jgi:RecB family endonuclease NucS